MRTRRMDTAAALEPAREGMTGDARAIPGTGVSRFPAPREYPSVAARVLPLRPPRDEPAEMLERARVGDDAARRWIFERHSPRVARVVASLLGRSGDVTDVVQEVFLTGFQRLDCVEDASKLGAWLAGIAVHKAQHARRSRRRRWWLSFLPPSDVPAMVSRSASPELRETVQATEAVLTRLDEAERAVLVLRFIEGMTIHEIAVACAVSPATVKRRIRRARADFVALAREDARLSPWTGGTDERE